jgi:hypothetical protein
MHNDDLDVLGSVVAKIVGNLEPRRCARAQRKVSLVLWPSGDGFDPALCRFTVGAVTVNAVTDQSDVVLQ